MTDAVDVRYRAAELRTDAYFRAAEMHLKRVETIQGIDWRVTILCWTLFVALAGTLVIYPQANLPTLWFKILGTSLLSAIWGAFLFMFCPQSCTSLISERNFYRYMRNRALAASGIEDGFILGRDLQEQLVELGRTPVPVLHERPRRAVSSLRDYWFKLVLTTVLLTGSVALIWFPKPGTPAPQPPGQIMNG